jgi:hypothetical protein
MNNPFNYQNDLTGFRSTLATEVAKHDQNVSNAYQRAVGQKADLIAKAKELKSAGEELVKQGLEAEIIPVAGKAVFKGGKAVATALKNRFGGSASESSGPVEEGAEGSGDPVEVEGAGDIELPSVGSGPAPVSSSTQPFGEINENTLTNSSPFTRNQPRASDITERVGNAEQTASNEVENLGSRAEQTAQEGAEAIGDTAEGAGNAISEAVQGATTAGEDALAGAGEAISGAAEGISSGIGAATGAIESGIGAATEGLTDAAVATSWIPFVGEVLGGLAAASALGAAGYGLYEEIKGGDAESAAEASNLQIAPTPKLNVAGSFVAPQQTSVEQ